MLSSPLKPPSWAHRVSLDILFPSLSQASTPPPRPRPSFPEEVSSCLRVRPVLPLSPFLLIPTSTHPQRRSHQRSGLDTPLTPWPCPRPHHCQQLQSLLSVSVTQLIFHQPLPVCPSASSSTQPSSTAGTPAPSTSPRPLTSHFSPPGSDPTDNGENVSLAYTFSPLVSFSYLLGKTCSLFKSSRVPPPHLPPHR